MRTLAIGLPGAARRLLVTLAIGLLAFGLVIGLTGGETLTVPAGRPNPPHARAAVGEPLEALASVAVTRATAIWQFYGVVAWNAWLRQHIAANTAAAAARASRPRGPARSACVKAAPDYGPQGAGNYAGPLPEYVTRRESNGNYRALNCSSGAGGRYQFLRSTWDHAAAAMGRPDLVGVPPQNASPADQDAVAAYGWGGGAGCSAWNAC